MTALADAEVIALARARQPALIEATQTLVRIDSQTPPSDTRAVAEAAAALLAGAPDVSVALHESAPPVVNLVARLEGGRPGPRLVLSGHLDTYPIGEGAWTSPPLGGEVRDGRLYGRGSADMKGACVALIETLRIFAERARPFAGEIVLALAGDEERMGELGTQWLIDHIPEVRGDGVIVADVGGPHTVRLGEKGMLWLDLRSEGRQAHGAHVHAGRNAADRLIDALADLRALAGLTPSPHPEAMAAIALAAGEPDADAPEAREVMRRVTVNLGRIEGGASANLVPAEAHAGLDIRLPLGVSVADAQAQAMRILSRHPDVTAEVTRRYEPSWTPETTPIARACLEAANAVLDRPAFFDMRIGGSDARLWRRAGYDAVVQGLTPNNLGAADEHLYVDELWRLLSIQGLAAKRFLSADAS